MLFLYFTVIHICRVDYFFFLERIECYLSFGITLKGVRRPRKLTDIVVDISSVVLCVLYLEYFSKCHVHQVNAENGVTSLDMSRRRTQQYANGST